MRNWQKLEDVKKFEIELSSHCNARCPLCIRQLLGTDKERPGFDKGHITFDQIKKIVSQLPNPSDVVFYFAGVGGDPLMNPQVVDIFRYCAERLKAVCLDTNGSLRAPKVWKDLGEISMKYPGAAITFSIDGLEDTNHLYRIRTKWSKIMQSAKEYINAGGIAEWKFIVFKHNEHQVEEAKKLAYKIGFHNFIWEPSVRHYSPEEDTFIKTEGIGELVPEVPTVTKQKNVRYEAIKSAKAISCKVLKKKMMYITHDFKLLPCCYFHSWQVIDDYLKFIGKSKDARTYFVNFNNDLNQRSLETIMEDEFFNKIISDWNSCKPDVCANNCNQNEYWNKEKYNDKISSNKI